MKSAETEWWQLPKNDEVRVEPREVIPPKPVKAPVAAEKTKTEETGEQKKPDRRRSLIIGAAGAALVGVALFVAMPEGEGKQSPAPIASTLNPEDFPPPAGEMPQDGADEVPLTGGEQEELASPVEPVVTLTATPAGEGETGALVKVIIRNDTEDVVTVMSSMMQGDGRSAMVGEGTLAPGSRRIDPGETVEGTVEFVTKKSPQQIVLTDLSGKVVASS